MLEGVYHMEIVRIKKRIKQICTEQGLVAFFWGKLRKKYYKQLREKYHFGEWHITPYELRPYAYMSVKELNRLCQEEKLSSVCEVGCGLGDIIRHVRVNEKVGIDSSENVVCAARHLGGAKYVVGSFDRVADFYTDLDLLIDINFIHNIEPDVLRKYYDNIFKRVYVKYILLDIVDGEGYPYKHDWKYLLPNFGVYKVVGKWGPRVVYILKNTSKNNKTEKDER